MDRGPEPEPEPEIDSHSFDKKPKARKNKDQAYKPESSSDSSGLPENVANDGMDDLAMIMGNMSKPGPRRSGRNVIKPTKYSPPKKGTKQKAHPKKRTIQKPHKNAKAKAKKVNPKSVAEITRQINKKQKELDTLKNKLNKKKSSEKKSSKKIYGRPATKYDRRDRASHSSTFSKSKSRSRSRDRSKSNSKDKGSFGLEDMFSKFKL